MNTFYEHHKDNIKFGYRCFDRILLNGLIQPFQQPERVIGFFNAYREGQRVTRNLLRDIAQQFQNWVKNRCQKWGAPILDAPQGRRDDFVDLYFRHAKKDQVVVILKAREPARIMIAIGAEDRWHLQLAQRWIVQYNFYINDQHWGRMFVRISPYLPFSARVCLNQHHWLANRMRAEGVDFEQCSNAFLKCSHPQKLQELADSLTANDLLSCGQKWLACLTPFFKESERKQAGCQQLLFAQVEYCDNLIFRRRAALDQLGQRLLDANRTIGQPQVRNFSPHTQNSYVQQVSLFARHFGKSPEVLGPEEIRSYQVYLTNEKKLAPSSILITVSALRFLYKVTLHRDWCLEDIIPAPKKPQKLPIVLSPEEVLQFLSCVQSIKHRTILTVCYAAGLRISEAVRLKVADIDSERMVIRVEQGKGQRCGAPHLRPYVLVKFMLRWQQDGSRKERWRLSAAT